MSGIRKKSVGNSGKSAESAARFVLPAKSLEAHYDAVVIGSGYGGSVAALRLAEANWGVAVLERGASIVAGDFPETRGHCVRTRRSTRTVDGERAAPMR